MVSFLKEFSKYRGIAGKTVARELAPSVLRGLLLELMNLYQPTTETFTNYVQKNQAIWNLLSEEWKGKIKSYAAEIGPIDWLSSEWLIDSVKKEYPQIASLFLGWTKARNWLDRQVESIKREIIS